MSGIWHVTWLSFSVSQANPYYDIFIVTTHDQTGRKWVICRIRTTSLLERTNRELRRKFRQAVTFGSRKGAEVAIYLQVQRLHARWTGESWWETSRALFFDLWNLHP